MHVLNKLDALYFLALVRIKKRDHFCKSPNKTPLTFWQTSKANDVLLRTIKLFYICGYVCPLLHASLHGKGLYTTPLRNYYWLSFLKQFINLFKRLVFGVCCSQNRVWFSKLFKTLSLNSVKFPHPLIQQNPSLQWPFSGLH